MKTVILTSYYKQTFSKLVKTLKSRKVKNIAYIINAKTPYLKENPDYVPGAKGMFIENGFKVRMIDLEKADLKKDFNGMDAVYVMGGNSFYLLDSMKKSGFDKVIGALLDKGVIYIGESAGSYVACPTIEMAHWKHQDADIVGLKDLTALNLVPFLVTVHYKPSFASVVDKEIKKCKYDVKKLTDNDMLIINDDNVKKVTLRNE